MARREENIASYSRYSSSQEKESLHQVRHPHTARERHALMQRCYTSLFRGLDYASFPHLLRLDGFQLIFYVLCSRFHSSFHMLPTLICCASLSANNVTMLFVCILLSSPTNILSCIRGTRSNSSHRRAGATWSSLAKAICASSPLIHRNASLPSKAVSSCSKHTQTTHLSRSRVR